MTEINIINNLIKETVGTLKKYKCKEFEKGNKLVIVIGEEHHNLDGQHFQEKIIKQLKPDYVLIELLHGINYEPIPNKVSFRDNSCINENDRDEKNDFEDIFFKNNPNDDFCYYKYISIRYGVKLIGCDVSLGELDRLPKDLGIESYGRGDFDDIRFDHARENRMIEIITTYLEKSSNLIVIMGNTHAEHICEINETLKNATYLFILLNNSSETPENYILAKE